METGGQFASQAKIISLRMVGQLKGPAGEGAIWSSMVTWQRGAQGPVGFLVDSTSKLPKLPSCPRSWAGMAASVQGWQVKHVRLLALISKGSWLRRGLAAWQETFIAVSRHVTIKS